MMTSMFIFKLKLILHPMTPVIDGLKTACGLLWCFYQLFGFSFWQHPFTAEDPFVSKWCNNKFRKYCKVRIVNNILCWPYVITYSLAESCCWCSTHFILFCCVSFHLPFLYEALYSNCYCLCIFVDRKVENMTLLTLTWMGTLKTS